MKDLLIKSDLTPAGMKAALAGTVAQLPDVAHYGRDIAKEIKRVFMVSCGGGLHMDNELQWWADTYGGPIRFQTYSAADFLTVLRLNNAHGKKSELDVEALVIISSKSGQTKETLAVGAMLRKGCKVVAFTQSENSMLVPYADKSFYTGDTPQAFQAMFMLKNAFFGGIWASELIDRFLVSLAALPGVMANAALLSQKRGREFAANFDTAGTVYFIASGPMEFTANAFGACLLQEMLKIDVNIKRADHFFHSFVERLPLKPADRIILLLGLDASRWQVEQVQQFCKDREFKIDVYDAGEYPMGEIDPSIRPMLAPIIVEAALKPMAEPLSKITKDLDLRNYMGNVNFWRDSWVDDV